MTCRTPRRWLILGGLLGVRMTAGMSLLGAYQGGMSTLVHDYLPQGHRPVIVINPRSVRLFRSMTRVWSLHLPASVDVTLIGLGNECRPRSFPFAQVALACPSSSVPEPLCTFTDL
ncbi:hypothetical protein H4582DRAFT_1218041 [Lactarius indigo]|nr:hypothetical protein H4582DRAFT_1218041 [Lactarius indigo]